MGGMGENPYESPLAPPEEREPSRLAVLLGKALPGAAEVICFFVGAVLFLLWQVLQ